MNRSGWRTDGGQSDTPGAGGGDASPGKRSLTGSLPVIQRKAAGDGAAGEAGPVGEAGEAGEAVQSNLADLGGRGGLGGGGGGAPLEGGVRSSMEQSFGRSFGDVRVHTDGAAGEAASQLNAQAFTAGNDIYFAEGKHDPESAEGKHLLAHELAHVAQNDGVAAKASGTGPSVSSPSDASEVAADRAADAVVRGEPVGDLGGGSAQLHRSPGPLSNTDKLAAAKKKSEIFSILAAMTETERTTTLTTDNAAMKHAAGKLGAGDLLELYGLYGHAPMTPHFMVHYAHESKHLKSMTASQWRRLIGIIGAEGVAEIRADGEMAKLMMKGAPNDVIQPWDLLEATGNGIAHPNAERIREAVNGLSAAQKTTLRSRADILDKILPKTKSVFWDVIPVINFPLLDAIKHLNELKLIKSLKKAQWAQLLAEAPKAEQDALIADATLWPIVEKHCDPGVLQIVRQNTTNAATAQGAFDDPVQLNAMFGSLGAPAFLALATQSTMPAPQVKDIYEKIKTATKVLPTLNGLPRGKAMGDDAAANLRRWVFDTGETDLPLLNKMFERRFGVNTGDKSPKMANKHADSSTTIGDFTPDTLRMSWPVMESLPPAAVEGNPRWRDFLANVHAEGTVGNAYYWENAVVMGVNQNVDAAGNPIAATQPVDTNAGVYWRTDAAGNLVTDAAGNPVPVDMNMPMWNATLRHEIGHAVDEQLGLTSANGVGVTGQPHAGAWKKYGSYEAFVDALIAANGGMRANATWPAAKDSKYRKVMIAAVKQTDTFLSQLAALYPAEPQDPALDAGAIAALWDPDRWTTQPWYDNSWVRIGGRCWQRGYDDAGSLYSFDSAARASHQVTDYQWRAPAEWFAEVYQVYYAEQEKGPAAPVGALLRSKDPQAAALMSGRVDRGFSPQDMRGGVTAKAPGT
jgi:hypothetical protein